MLGINGQDAPTARACCGQYKLAARDEALLVGEREIATRVESREAGFEAYSAHHGVEDKVGTALDHELGEHEWTAADWATKG